MPTALVTGASSGIGASFARRLAATGHDLVVVARDRARLQALADELRVDVEVLPADLTDADQRRAVEERLADGERPVDVLVNNAGFGTNATLATASPDGLDREVTLDVLVPVRLSRAAVPGMLARGQGGILNVASVAAFAPGPGFAVYSASKAFVLSFSEALHEEVRGTGVKVSCVCPGFTRTEFQERGGFDTSRLPGIVWATADEVAAAALKALARNDAVCVPGVSNKMLAGLTHLLPRDVVRRVSGSSGRALNP